MPFAAETHATRSLRGPAPCVARRNQGRARRRQGRAQGDRHWLSVGVGGATAALLRGSFVSRFESQSTALGRDGTTATEPVIPQAAYHRTAGLRLLQAQGLPPGARANTDHRRPSPWRAQAAAPDSGARSFHGAAAEHDI